MSEMLCTNCYRPRHEHWRRALPLRIYNEVLSGPLSTHGANDTITVEVILHDDCLPRYMIENGRMLAYDRDADTPKIKIDPSIPKDTIIFKSEGKELGRIINLKDEP